MDRYSSCIIYTKVWIGEHLIQHITRTTKEFTQIENAKLFEILGSALSVLLINEKTLGVRRQKALAQRKLYRFSENKADIIKQNSPPFSTRSLYIGWNTVSLLVFFKPDRNYILFFKISSINTFSS